MSAAIQFKLGLFSQQRIEWLKFVCEDADLGPENLFLVAERQLNLIGALKIELFALNHTSLFS